MSGIDLCHRLTVQEVLCPECYEWVKVNSITDGPLMNEAQKKKQQEEYLQWEAAQRERLKRASDVSDDVGLFF